MEPTQQDGSEVADDPAPGLENQAAGSNLVPKVMHFGIGSFMNRNEGRLRESVEIPHPTHLRGEADDSGMQGKWQSTV